MTTVGVRMSARARVGGKARLRDLRQTRLAWARTALGRQGALPSFIIIGAQRAGTTSLFTALAEHDQVRPPIGKELQYFSLHFRRDLDFYRGHFPRLRPGEITFEASPYYLFHPDVPRRVAQALPSVKTVVMLRDPVSRAYSHWQHSVLHGYEPFSFADAIDAEADRLGRAATHGVDSKRWRDAMRHHSYLARGRYAEQLHRWFEHLGRDRVHVIRSEAFFAEVGQGMADLYSFLGLPPGPSLPQRSNSWPHRGPNELTPAMVERLQREFRPHNEALSDLLGWRETPWAAPSTPATRRS